MAVGDPNTLGHQGVPTVRLSLSGVDPGRIGGMPLPQGVEMTHVNGIEWRATMGDGDVIEELVADLVNAGIGVRAVVPEQVSLEEEYLRLVGGERHE